MQNLPSCQVTQVISKQCLTVEIGTVMFALQLKHPLRKQVKGISKKLVYMSLYEFLLRPSVPRNRDNQPTEMNDTQ